MHRLHDYVVQQLGEKLKARKMKVDPNVKTIFCPQ